MNAPLAAVFAIALGLIAAGILIWTNPHAIGPAMIGAGIGMVTGVVLAAIK